MKANKDIILGIMIGLSIAYVFSEIMDLIIRIAILYSR